MNWKNFLINLAGIIAIIILTALAYTYSSKVFKEREDVRRAAKTHLEECLQHGNRELTSNRRIVVKCRDLDGEEKFFPVGE